MACMSSSNRSGEKRQTAGAKTGRKPRKRRPDSSVSRQERSYRKRMAAGLCTKCGKRKLHTARHCEKCAEAQRKDALRRYYGKRGETCPPTREYGASGIPYPAGSNEYHREYMRRVRARKREQLQAERLAIAREHGGSVRDAD